MKKKSTEQIQNEIKHQKIINAGFIKDIYPELKEINFEFKIENPDGLSISPNYKPSYSKSKRLPQHSACFQFECKDRECVNGGFNLTKEIKNMIQVHKLESSGQLICQGWQDPQRINQHHCLIELNYIIRILYKE
jgi:hypothetical protein